MPGQTDLRRPDRVQRYVPPKQPETSSADHINAIGMVCSLVGLLIKVIFIFRQTYESSLSFVQMKWAAWIGVYCSLIYMANSRAADDKKQMLSLLM